MNRYNNRIDPLCENVTQIACPPGSSEFCSPLFSTSEIGDYCRKLFSELTDADRDTVMEDYCLRNNTNECKCVNRALNPDYQKLKLGNPFSDSCWYIPCANRTQFLVPSDFNKETKCPENICQIVYNTAQTHDVDIDHVKNDINCDFTHGGIIPSSGENVPTYIYYAMILLAVAFIVIYAMKT